MKKQKKVHKHCWHDIITEQEPRDFTKRVCLDRLYSYLRDDYFGKLCCKCGAVTP